MLLGDAGERTVTGTQVTQNRQVRVEHEHALVVRGQRVEHARFVKHIHGLDALGVERVHIIFAIRCLVHEAGTFNRVDIVGGEDLERVRAGGATFGECLVVREVREDRPIAPAFHLGAFEFAHDFIVVTELLGVGLKTRLADIELLAGELALRRAHFDIVDVSADDDGEVGRHSPRGGGPEHGVSVVLVTQFDGHGYGGVLPILIDVGIHAQLMVAQRGAILGAIRQHAVAFVGEALVVQLLERPHDGFHVRGVQGLIPVVEVHPTALTVHVFTPFVRVFEHGSTAGVVELGDAHLVDVVDRVNAEFLLRFELRRQTVRVPPEDAVDFVAFHGLVAGDDVLRVSGQQVAVVRQAVGERRAVEEHELVLAVVAGWAAFYGFVEGVVSVPIIQHGLFELGEIRVRRDVGALFAG